MTDALDEGTLVSYPEALRERGTLGGTEVTGGGAHVSLPSWQRTLPQRYRLIAVVALPPTGEIVAVTVIGQGGAPPEFIEYQRRGGPFAVAIVEITTDTGSVRLPGQLTDCDPQDPAMGDAVTATFRRIYEVEGVTRYGLKFTPE